MRIVALATGGETHGAEDSAGGAPCAHIAQCEQPRSSAGAGVAGAWPLRECAAEQKSPGPGTNGAGMRA